MGIKPFNGLAGSLLVLVLTACVSQNVEMAKPAGPESEPAVIALVSSAQQQESSGQLNQAAASLERALRISPRDPLIWHQLAKIRLKQHRAQQAIQFANRSNSLAGKGHSLHGKNWLLIADAYEELGDHRSAATAREKSRQKAGQ